jgi:hypothetical protein
MARLLPCNIPFPAPAPSGCQHTRTCTDCTVPTDSCCQSPKHRRHVMLPRPLHNLHFSRISKSSCSVSTILPCCPSHGTQLGGPPAPRTTTVRVPVRPAASLLDDLLPAPPAEVASGRRRPTEQKAVAATQRSCRHNGTPKACQRTPPSLTRKKCKIASRGSGARVCARGGRFAPRHRCAAPRRQGCSRRHRSQPAHHHSRVERGRRGAMALPHQRQEGEERESQHFLSPRQLAALKDLSDTLFFVFS